MKDHFVFLLQFIALGFALAVLFTWGAAPWWHVVIYAVLAVFFWMLHLRYTRPRPNRIDRITEEALSDD